MRSREKMKKGERKGNEETEGRSEGKKKTGRVKRNSKK